MKLLPLLIAAIVLIAVACSKDKFTSTPQIEIKSISPGEVVSGDVITVKGKYTDKEGDLDSVLVVYKWYNGAIVTKHDTFRYSLTNFKIPPKTVTADLDINFEFNTFNTAYANLSSAGMNKDTTATFGIVLKDKDSLRSNYAESAAIRIKKP